MKAWLVVMSLSLEELVPKNKVLQQVGMPHLTHSRNYLASKREDICKMECRQGRKAMFEGGMVLHKRVHKPSHWSLPIVSTSMTNTLFPLSCDLTGLETG